MGNSKKRLHTKSLKWHLTQIKVVQDGSEGHRLVYSNWQTYSLTGSRDTGGRWFQFVLANLSAVTLLSPSGSSYIPGLAHWPSHRRELSRKDKRVRVEKCMFVLVWPPVSRWPPHRWGEKTHECAGRSSLEPSLFWNTWLPVCTSMRRACVRACVCVRSDRWVTVLRHHPIYGTHVYKRFPPGSRGGAGVNGVNGAASVSTLL